jgi:hypothetical protein
MHECIPGCQQMEDVVCNNGHFGDVIGLVCLESLRAPMQKTSNHWWTFFIFPDGHGAMAQWQPMRDVWHLLSL